MNFYNPAHFTRFVKTQTGFSPSELKQKMRKEQNADELSLNKL